MTKHAELREINNPEACAVELLKCAIAWEPYENAAPSGGTDG